MVTGRLRQRSWDTPEGEKRSVTEIEADEVGASLKWATAKVERISQRGNGQRDQGQERAAERGGDFNDAPPFEQPFDAVGAPGFGGGHRLVPTNRLDASSTLAWAAAAGTTRFCWSTPAPTAARWRTPHARTP
jgi:single-stranded DNA-binding protein